MKKRKIKENWKKFEHIAVSQDLKKRFDDLRYKLIGEEKRLIKTEDLLNLLLNNYENGKNK